jgi:UDP-N-acetylglucosamine 1-carboxyvinyltransferase
MSGREHHVGDALSISGAGVLNGRAFVQGAKNTAQKVIPMCAMAPAHYVFDRVPCIADTDAVLRVIEHLGGSTWRTGARLEVDTTAIQPRPIPRELTVQATGTFHFAGALLARFGQAELAPPGGDDIGARPVDVHLNAFRLLGASVEYVSGNYVLRREAASAGVVRLPIPSAGAFINTAQMAFGLPGPTKIENVPLDSDTRAAMDLMTTMGAGVEFSTESDRPSAVITGSSKTPSEVRFTLPADRNDAATWLMSAGIGLGRVEVTGVAVSEMRLVMAFLTDLGAEIQVQANTVSVDCTRGLDADGYELLLGPSPGFHSDWGPFAQAVLARARGRSLVEDRMYEGRYQHVDDLVRLGADISRIRRNVPLGALMFDREATVVTALEVIGGTQFRPADVEGRDVRGAATLALAAGAATGGVSVVAGRRQFSRGYEDFEGRLSALGPAVEFRT